MISDMTVTASWSWIWRRCVNAIAPPCGQSRGRCAFYIMPSNSYDWPSRSTVVMIKTTTAGMGWVDNGQLERHAGSPRALRLLHNSNAGNDQVLAVVAALTCCTIAQWWVSHATINLKHTDTATATMIPISSTIMMIGWPTPLCHLTIKKAIN